MATEQEIADPPRGNGKVALITGVSGQDGAYLAEFLLGKGYVVHGIKRRSSRFNTDHIDHLFQAPKCEQRRFFLHHGDLTVPSSLTRIIEEVQPDEIYNLGALSHVAESFDYPEYTAEVDALGPLRLLEAVRRLGLEGKTRFFQASAGDIFGQADDAASEDTPFRPRSPFAIAKLYAYWITVHYRDAYGMYACNGIQFNHESPLRGETFVTRKITRGLARVALGLEDCVYLGNLDAQRECGHARDYVEMQWRILQQDRPEDFVIATGCPHSVREFADTAAAALGIRLRWEGKGIDEMAVVAEAGPFPGVRQGQVVVRVDPHYYRPLEIARSCGDAGKAREQLGWMPKTSFAQLVGEMVRADLQSVRKDYTLQDYPHRDGGLGLYGE